MSSMPVNATIVLLGLLLGLAAVALLLLLRRIGSERAEQRRLRALADRQALSLQALEQQVLGAQREQSERAGLLASLAHEIRPALETLLAQCLDLAPSLQPRRQSEQLLRIQRSGRLARGIVDDILDQVALDAGDLRLQQEDFEVDGLPALLTEALAEPAQAKGLDLIIELEPDVPARLNGDLRRLAEVLRHLADDGVRHTEAGEVYIRIGLDEPRAGLAPLQPGEDFLLRCEVSDTRSEAAQADIDRRLSMPALASADRGLSISHRLAGLMGGRLQAGSTPAGLVMTLTTALRTAQADGRFPPVQPAHELRGRRAMVVEHNEHARHAVRRMLEQLGMEVVAIGSGHAAVQAAATADSTGRGFQLVLVDWQLPGVSGAETVRLLQARGLLATPAVVKMSAPNGDDALATAPGVTEVLLKPIMRLPLLDSVLRLLDADDMEGSSPAPTRRKGNEWAADMPSEVAALAGARVLLVEDNEISQEIAIDLLESSGLQVQLAEHGQAAIELLNWQYFDLVLMDMHMPTLDGIKATQLIRADRRHQSLPIIAMTAASRDVDRRRCLNAGMNEHLTKPFELEELWAVLTRWIAPRPGLGGSAASAPVAEVAAGEEDSPAATLPETIPGIDVGDAMRRMRGGPEFYLRVARMFVDTQSDAAERVRDALQAGDRDAALRHATTLKNLAANLGARTLQDSALALEASLREAADPMVLKTAARVEESLEVICFALQSLLAKQGRRAAVAADASVAPN